MMVWSIEVIDPRYSALDVLAGIWYGRAAKFAKSKIAGRVLREVQRGLFRPFSFHGRLTTLLRLLRWAKFVGPLFGTCNKFRGHLLDMIEKRRQHVKSRAARERWTVLLDALSRRSREERAVLNLQRRFREGREAKARTRFALMSQTRETSNARVAHEIRRRLAEEHRLSRLTLERIEMSEGRRRALRQLSQHDRGNIVRHRRSERRMKKRLLLSPKTSFAVVWKYLTIACAAIEVSQFLLAPALSGELKKMPLDSFLLRVMNASPADRCDKNGARIAPPSFFYPATCGTTSTRRRTWLFAARIFAAVLAPTVNAIVFLDVFVTFFTGESTSSGTLVPKSLLARWIFPGVGLQLVVNPTMVEISKWVKRTIVRAVRVGPSLSFHLLLSCVPLGAYVYDRVLDAIFDFVERQNKILSK
ncbi:hypothetical protein ACHAW5_001951 [Stephanodiscus triporus]|uniref:Uncharacterized protein n=1 Tax=Stephanodiscus triporus TaxID=2934178 RepID=A0ABD3MZ91_9STRA